MPRRLHFGKQLRISWLAVVVLAAVCSLTISLATRYSYSAGISSLNVESAHAHPSPDSKGQRLTKNGAAWVAPVFGHLALRAPSFYSFITRPEAPAPNFLLEENFFTRPPPQS